MSHTGLRHELSSYVPRVLLERLDSGTPLVTPEARETTGAVLLSDIQGFTAMVESFASRGRAGLEEFTWLLNGYVTDVVEKVEACGGDVLSIAGDAFLCYWAAPTADDLPEAILRAAQAGLAIQDAVHDRPAGPGRRFATRIGIAAGDLLIAYAGGCEARWELVASGTVLGDVAAAERSATPGSVVLSESAWQHVAELCDGDASRDGVVLRGIQSPAAPLTSRPPRFASSDTVLQPFVPPAVLGRLVAADAEWLAESRSVTVVLAAVPGMAKNSREELKRIDDCLRGFQEIVLRFEGTVRVDIDDKGLLLLAVFGLPPRAHEDDAMRAVLAAGELHRVLLAARVEGGIGVATGRALCGAFGSDVRRDYIVRGDVINLSARLMQVERGSVVCDEATMRAVRGRIAFEARAPITVRGRTEPMPVYRPAGRAFLARPASQVIGRSRELRMLAARCDIARADGHAGVTIIEADAGLGKSKLINELSSQATASGMRVLTAAADAMERSTAYFAWRPVLTAIFGITPDDNLASARERVLRATAGHPKEERLLPLLSGMIDVQIADTPLTAEMIGDVRADNTKALVRRILGRYAASAPVMLVVEDAHWLDSSSWGMLLDAAQYVRPLMIVVTTRPFGDTPPTDFSRLASLAGEQVLRLDGLSSDETRTLIEQRLQVTAVPESLVSLVGERVAGNPFFCEELLQAMVESGVVQVIDGVCTVGALNTLDLPTTVEGVIVSRLDRLSPRQQLCLKVASVIGRVFRERLVRETHPVDTERGAVSAHLLALAAVDLTALDSPDPDLAYLFKHVITRDVTYESMPFAQRQPLHRAVAQWYERNHGADMSPHYALLAYHWARAADSPRTVDYLEKAGEQALYAGAFRDALVFLSQAAELVDRGEVVISPTRRALWEKGIGRAHYYLGALDASRRHNERALVALHRPVPATSARAGLGVLAELARQVSHRVWPSRYLGRRASSQAVLNEAVECYKILGQAYYLEGEPALKLLYLTVTGLNVGEEAGSSAALARVMINASVVALLVGQPKQGEWYAKRAIAMGEREGLSASAYVWHIRALALAQRAAWAEAKAASAKAIALTLELGDFGLEGEAWMTRTTIALCEGDFAFAPTGWKRQRELAERFGNAHLRCWSLIDEVDTWNGVGNTAEAERALADALAIERPTSDLGTSLDLARSTAVTRLRQGRDADAVRAADAVFEPLKRQPPTGYQWADDFCEVIDVYLTLLEANGSYAAAHRRALETRVAEGCRLAKRFSRIYRNVYPRAWLLQGRLLRLQGKHDQALTSLRRARDIGAEMQMPFERARAELELARASEGQARRSLVDSASTTFEALGATYYQQLAQTV